MENPYFITLESAIKEVLDKEGYPLVTKNPQSDPDIQNQQILEMIDEGIDAIFICPVNWVEITEALEALREADVKIINVDTQVNISCVISNAFWNSPLVSALPAISNPASAEEIAFSNPVILSFMEF